MSFFDDNFHRLAHTDWIDADTGSNLQVIKDGLGFKPRTVEHLTRAERIAHGLGTAEDIEALKHENETHKQWLASDEGKAWLEKSGLARSFGAEVSQTPD